MGPYYHHLANLPEAYCEACLNLCICLDAAKTSTHCRRVRLACVVQKIDKSCGGSVCAANAMHSMLALASDTSAITHRFVELKELGVKPDLVTYNTLLKACMRSANLPCAEVIMTQLRQQGLQACLLPTGKHMPQQTTGMTSSY